jgi:hypothetical protein
MQPIPIRSTISVVPQRGHTKSLTALINRLQQSVSRVIFNDSKVQIYKYSNGSDTWWYAFDPQTGRSIYADSEIELRVLIENKFHHW